MDASHHPWLEERTRPMALHAAIVDATGKIGIRQQLLNPSVTPDTSVPIEQDVFNSLLGGF